MPLLQMLLSLKNFSLGHDYNSQKRIIIIELWQIKDSSPNRQIKHTANQICVYSIKLYERAIAIQIVATAVIIF